MCEPRNINGQLVGVRGERLSPEAGMDAKGIDRPQTTARRLGRKRKFEPIRPLLVALTAYIVLIRLVLQDSKGAASPDSKKSLRRRPHSRIGCLGQHRWPLSSRFQLEVQRL